MAFQWQEFSNKEYSKQFATIIIQALHEVITSKGSVRLHVSGGKSPIPFFKELSIRDIAWENVAVSLVDERMVCMNHQDSNTALLHQYLLQNHAKQAKWLPLIEDTLLPDVKQLLKFAHSHYMQPDIVILGMGTDGHTASIFPDSPMLEEALSTQEVIIHTQSPSASHDRLSMSLFAIEQTPHVFLAIQGEEKKNVFDRASLKQNQSMPISYILHSKKVVCHVYYSK